MQKVEGRQFPTMLSKHLRKSFIDIQTVLNPRKRTDSFQLVALYGRKMAFGELGC